MRCCGQPANKGFVWLYWFHILEIIGFLVGFLVPLLTLLSVVRAFANKILSPSMKNDLDKLDSSGRLVDQALMYGALNEL